MGVGRESRSKLYFSYSHSLVVPVSLYFCYCKNYVVMEFSPASCHASQHSIQVNFNSISRMPSPLPHPPPPPPRSLLLTTTTLVCGKITLNRLYHIYIQLTAPFNNIRTLNFKTQLTICTFTAINHNIMETTTDRKSTKWIKISQSQYLNVTFWTHWAKHFSFLRGLLSW